MALRSLASALILASAAAACSGAAKPLATAPARANACEPAHLEACELGLRDALASGVVERAAVERYAAARAARDASDPWTKLWRALPAKPAAAAATVLSDGAAAGAAPPGATALGSAKLDDPRGISGAELLLAMGSAAGVGTIVRVRGAEVTELFSADPLAPFVGALPAVARDDGALPRLASDLALAASIRRAFAAAGAVRYVEAAKEAEQLSALLDARGPSLERAVPTLRARYALQLLASAGLVIDPPPSPADDAEPKPAPALPEPGPTDTPYGSFLAVRLAPKDEAGAWKLRRDVVLRGVREDRREALDALFAPPSDCSAKQGFPPMDGPRDLIFGGKLAYATAHMGSPAIEVDAPALLVSDWIPRYEAFVRATEATRTFWSNAPSVLYERGELDGLSPAGTAVYRHVTELGVAHLGALEELERTFPGRFRAMSGVPLAYSPGVVRDARLRDRLIALTQATIQDKIARARGDKALFEGVVMGGLAGMSYPAAIQSAYYTAIQGAFSAKLHGELLRERGWGVAGFYALDAAFRQLTEQPVTTSFAAEQVVRALGDSPELRAPELAGVARAAARYAALALAHELHPTSGDAAHVPAPRRAAREELARAIDGLGGPRKASDDEPVPRNMVEDLTELTDGLIATISAALAPKAKPAAAMCAAKVTEVNGPEARRSLAKLGDLRQRILAYPRYKDGRGAWIRRARLLVTVLSDAMDGLSLRDAARGVGQTPKARAKQPRFTITDAAAEAALSGGLEGWDSRAGRLAVTDAYILARGVFTTKDVEAFLHDNGARVRELLIALLAALEEDPDPHGGGVALLRALSSMQVDDKGAATDMTALLVSYARGFYAKKQPDQGDMMLLGALTVSAVSERPPPPEVLELAAANGSRIEWALRFLGEMSAPRSGASPEPTRFAEGMRRAAAAQCAPASVDEIVDVAGAIRDFAAGKRKEARKALDAVLARAEAKGLAVPKVTFKYDEKTETKVFTLSLDVSYGAGILHGANSFQVGLGVRSKGEPEGALSTLFAAPESLPMAEDAARYYAEVAAIAAAYHFLDGDPARGAAAARRVVSTAVSGVRLGPRAVPSSAKLGTDIRPIVALDAELAGEAGLPFLAGDLFTVARATLKDDMDDASIVGILSPLPMGLAAVKDPALDKLVARAERSLKLLAAPLPCTEAKTDPAPLEAGTCESYALGVGLRSVDALKKLPRLRKGAELGNPKCAVLRAVDDFLGLADKGNYDPDAFTRAVLALKAEGAEYDAAVLFTRHRKDTHCSPQIIAIARELGRLPELGPQLRSDLLTVAVNCTIHQGLDTSLEADLAELDRTTRALPDPSRNLHFMLFVADFALQTEQWGFLEQLTGAPDFVSRWLKVHASAAAAALVVEHATRVLTDKPLDAARSKASYELLCETYPPAERAEACAKLAALRSSDKAPRSVRERMAKDALRLVVSAANAKPAAPPTPAARP